VASIPGCKGVFTTTDPNSTTNHKTTCDYLVPQSVPSIFGIRNCAFHRTPAGGRRLGDNARSKKLKLVALKEKPQAVCCLCRVYFHLGFDRVGNEALLMRRVVQVLEFLARGNALAAESYFGV